MSRPATEIHTNIQLYVAWAVCVTLITPYLGLMSVEPALVT